MKPTLQAVQLGTMLLLPLKLFYEDAGMEQVVQLGEQGIQEGTEGG